MQGSRNHLVLSLIAGLLLLEAILLAYNLARHFASPTYTYWRVAIVFAILVGLWLHSNYARFLGAAWLVFSSAAVAWPLITPRAFVWNPFLIWMVSYLALGLMSSYFLLLSKPFGVEFIRQPMRRSSSQDR
jgi:hypothetical protein